MASIPSKSSKKKHGNKLQLPQHLSRINVNAAGIDIGSEAHYVAVPCGRDERPVRRFGCFTSDLYAMADWLKQCGVDTVAMESTGVYWIPVYQVLESRGFDVKLINSRQIRYVPGRKSDISDCQWIQELHTYGLLRGSFRPNDEICVLRSYLRQRNRLIEYGSAHIQHMQKAMIQMNIHLHKVISDITGVTGMQIIRAIVKGERNPHVLAEMRHGGIKSSYEEIVKSLEGDWREEHIFNLEQALALYDMYQAKILECDERIQITLEKFDKKVDVIEKPLPPKKTGSHSKNKMAFNLRSHLYEVSGVDLTTVDGIDVLTAQTIISEWGLNMNKFPSEKHLGSWLGLSPNHRITGDKIKSRKTKKVINRSATALRLAARSVGNSQSALGAFYRRMRFRLGAPKAITATAYKLAKICYRLLKYGGNYVDQGQDYYEQKYKERILHNLKKRAKNMGFLLIPNNDENTMIAAT